MLKIYEINRIDQFFELRHEWNKVLAKSRDKNIFLTWEYLSTYWRHFGKEKELRILYIEDNDEIIAIAPFRLSRYGYSGPFGYGVIEPLGYRGLTPEGADYTGLILTEREAECLKLFLNYLVENDDWDFIYMYDIPETSIILDLLPKISNYIPNFKIIKVSKCFYISLPNSMDAYMKELSRNTRKKLRKCMRDLKRDYSKVDLKTFHEFGSVEESMRIHFKLNQKRWNSMNMPGTYSTQEIRNFYIDVAQRFAKNGWLSLYFLTVNDEPISGLYGFTYKQKMYAAVSGFDTDYSQYGVGKLLEYKVIEKCIENNLIEYDMMKGEESYKSQWTSKYRRNLGIRFINKKITSNIYDWGIQTVKQMNKLLGRL